MDIYLLVSFGREEMKELEKIQIRESILDIRDNMSESEVDELSEKIISTLVKLPIFKKSSNIMLYLSFNNEVDSFRLIDYCKQHNKKVIIPFCIKNGTKIVPTEIKDVEKDLVRSSFGYMHPKRDIVKPVDIESIDLIIVPGISFDKRCYRIGFGAGYYDRFLGKLNFKIPTVGLAYDFQIITSVPTEYYDIPLDYVVTEKRIIIR